MTRKPLKASAGGCWFCEMDECDMFTFEFDAYFHKECLRNALDSDPHNDEAQIIAREHGWSNSLSEAHVEGGNE